MTSWRPQKSRGGVSPWGSTVKGLRLQVLSHSPTPVIFHSPSKCLAQKTVYLFAVFNNRAPEFTEGSPWTRTYTIPFLKRLLCWNPLEDAFKRQWLSGGFQESWLFAFPYRDVAGSLPCSHSMRAISLYFYLWHHCCLMHYHENSTTPQSELIFSTSIPIKYDTYSKWNYFN